jgi:hypothetical protein
VTWSSAWLAMSKQGALSVAVPDAFYVAAGQWMWADVQSIVVRTAGDAAALAPAVRRAIWSASRNLAIVRMATMEEIVAASEAERRFALIVFRGLRAFRARACRDRGVATADPLSALRST